MRAIYDIGVIHIEVTNACNLQCSSCTRFVGHHSKPFSMDLETVEIGLGSLQGFPNKIGLMGGEPTIHPQFVEICKLYRNMIPEKSKRCFWTNGANWNKYEDIILDTFYPQNIVYNDHKNPEGVHQPLMIAAKDIIDDEELMWELIDDCWIQERWSASITPKGGFFCEVAAAQDMLFNGPGGYMIEKGWWNKTPADYRDQVERYCINCSAAIPLPRIKSKTGKDLVSSSVYQELRNISSPKLFNNEIELFDSRINRKEIKENRKNWSPWSHRNFKQCTPGLFLNETNQLVDINGNVYENC
jgi:hypothetical protein